MLRFSAVGRRAAATWKSLPRWGKWSVITLALFAAIGIGAAIEGPRERASGSNPSSPSRPTCEALRSEGRSCPSVQWHEENEGPSVYNHFHSTPRGERIEYREETRREDGETSEREFAEGWAQAAEQEARERAESPTGESKWEELGRSR